MPFANAAFDSISLLFHAFKTLAKVYLFRTLPNLKVTQAKTAIPICRFHCYEKGFLHITVFSFLKRNWTSIYLHFFSSGTHVFVLRRETSPAQSFAKQYSGFLTTNPLNLLEEFPWFFGLLTDQASDENPSVEKKLRRSKPMRLILQEHLRDRLSNWVVNDGGGPQC